MVIQNGHQEIRKGQMKVDGKALKTSCFHLAVFLNPIQSQWTSKPVQCHRIKGTRFLCIL